MIRAAAKKYISGIKSLYESMSKDELLLSGYQYYYSIASVDNLDDIKKLVDLMNKHQIVDWCLNHFYNKESCILNIYLVNLFMIFYYLERGHIIKIMHPELESIVDRYESLSEDIKELKKNNVSNINNDAELDHVCKLVDHNKWYYGVLLKERNKEIKKFFKEKLIGYDVVVFYNVHNIYD